MAAKLKVEYYTVTMPDGESRTLEQVLRDVKQKPRDQRNVGFDGVPVRLQAAAPVRRNWEGDLVRIRMEDLPPKASLGGDVAPLDLEEDEGVGSETAFVYHPPLRVLAIQGRGRSGVSARVFGHYFEQLGDIDGAVDIDPVLLPDALQRLRGMRDMRSVTVRVAAPRNVRTLANDDVGLGEALDVLHRWEAPHIELSASMGHAPRDRYLNWKRLRSDLLKLLGARDRGRLNVLKIEVKGRSPGSDAMEVLDLFQYRMRDEVALADGVPRTIPYEVRVAAVRKGLDARLGALRDLLVEPR